MKVHSKLILILWRKRLFFLVIITFLLCLWTWSIYNLAKRDRFIIKEYSSIPRSEHFLDRLISQANQVIKYQQKEKKKQKSGSLRDLKNIPKIAPIMENIPFEEERLKILQKNFQGEPPKYDEMDDERMPSSSERDQQLNLMGIPIVPGLGPGKPIRPPHERIVHLDLKGAPPKLSFLKQLIPVIKALGGTGLLIEYEDMFPYSGFLTSIAAQNAYKADDLKDFLEFAALHQLKIIPLVQTFGHLEFALKYEEFRNLRENPNSPQSICPSHSDTLLFLEEMLKQVIEFHFEVLNKNLQTDSEKLNSPSGTSKRQKLSEKFTHIHIGCDEVYTMAQCDKCKLKSRNEVFLTHVTNIGNFIKTKWPSLKTIIWDDMLRSMSLSELLHWQIGIYVEPMIWIYYHDIYNEIKPTLWDIYSKVFSTAWAASAFKGAFGETLTIPPLKKHLENNMRWLAVIHKEGGRFLNGFRGIALTGWQRYDHFATLCELLPSGMPSLILCLSTVSKGYFDTDPTKNELLNVLQFDRDIKQNSLVRDWINLNEYHIHNYHDIFLQSNYIGSTVYKFIIQLSEKLSEIDNYLVQTKRKSAWMSSYNVRNNFISPLRAMELKNLSENYQHVIFDLIKVCHNVMFEVYDEHIINEFIEQNIYPYVKELNEHLNIAKNSSNTNIWSRRPFRLTDEFKNFMSMAMVASADSLPNF